MTLPLFQGFLEGHGHLLCLQGRMHMVTDDLAGVSIRDQAQVSKALLRRQVGDVSDPDLLRPYGGPFRITMQEIRVAVEAVMTVGGLVIGPAVGHQQPGLPEQAKQGVAPQVDAGFCQHRLEHDMELTGTHPWLAHAHFPYPLQNHDFLRFPMMRPGSALIVGLPAEANEAAGLRDAYSNSFLPFERKPEGFFGTDTPYSVLMMSSMDSNSCALSLASLS